MNMLPQADRQNLLKQLKRHEGAKRDADGLHIAYRCTAGALTIGYGHNLDAKPVPGVTAESRLNESQACRLLAADIEDAERLLINALRFVRNLDPVRCAALVNMTFNLGVGGLLTFKNTLADIERGDYAEAARRMLQSKWARQVGDGPGKKFDRAEELAEQIRTGRWA